MTPPTPDPRATAVAEQIDAEEQNQNFRGEHYDRGSNAWVKMAARHISAALADAKREALEKMIVERKQISEQAAKDAAQAGDESVMHYHAGCIGVCLCLLGDLASLSGSQGQWQDISTAKANCVVEQDYLVGNAKDGVWVATWHIGSAYPHGDFFPVTGYWSSNDDPTHWQPLPAPPDPRAQ